MFKKPSKPRCTLHSTGRKSEENQTNNISNKIYLKVKMCSLHSVAPDLGKCHGKISFS